MGAGTPEAPGKGPKKMLKNCIFEKKEYRRCVENTYVVSRCRRGKWYIWCASVTSLPGAQQACLILRTGISST